MIDGSRRAAHRRFSDWLVGLALDLDAVLPEASTPLAARGFFFIIESRRAVLLHANSLSPATLCLL